MNTPQALIAFIAAASILTVTPGVDTAMVLRSAAAGGPRPAAWAAAGIGLGCLVWGLAVSAGLGALLAASPLAFTMLKWAGAAYLVFLGLKLILRPRDTIGGEESGAAHLAPGQAFRQGLLTNALNPKIGIFYVTFLPQFVPAGANVAAFSFLLAAVHVLLSIAWFAALIAASVPMGRILRRPRVIKALDRGTGGVFVAFGGKLALTS
ncbi:LysE family translocator [Sphingomonas parva]|uniref:LysE family translocator n=1 Tax=Sphingomonas parva TaxID=2555898 RepID=A0A4Y8ZVU6_9SPHN|nr:LysE family translocator [Sphingomonas parva]TFI58556.1 LysE family translocator [Sphingomonas parva]